MIKMILLLDLMDKDLMKEGILLRKFRIKKVRLILNTTINMDIKLQKINKMDNK